MTEPVRNAEAFVRELIKFRKAVKDSTPILHYGVATTPEQAAQDLADYKAKQTASHFHRLVEERAQAIAAARLAETAP